MLSSARYSQRPTVSMLGLNLDTVMMHDSELSLQSFLISFIRLWSRPMTFEEDDAESSAEETWLVADRDGSSQALGATTKSLKVVFYAAFEYSQLSF